MTNVQLENLSIGSSVLVSLCQCVYLCLRACMVSILRFSDFYAYIYVVICMYSCSGKHFSTA